MAETGFDQAKINRLLSTNLIRVFAFDLQAILAAAIALAALMK